MIHQLSDKKYDIILDYSVVGNLKPFKEEVLEEMYNIHKTHGDIPLLFSGGMDSTFMLRCLMELGLKPKTITFSFTKDNSDFDCELARQKCINYNLDTPEFFYFDGEEFLDYTNYLINEKDIGYPMIHGYFMDFFLSKYKGEKFYCGMQGEYKLKNKKIFMPYGPLMVKQNYPDTLYCFTTDRTFLSYFKHEKFINNYRNKPQRTHAGGEDAWYVRDLIYMDCFPDMVREIKNLSNPWRDYIKEPWHRDILPTLLTKYPQYIHPVECIPPCEFDSEFLVNL